MTYKLHDSLLEKVEGSFICVIDGMDTYYESAKDLLTRDFEKKYVVSSISARENKVVITLKENDVIPNDLNADWVQEQIAKTGKEISFF